MAGMMTPGAWDGRARKHSLAMRPAAARPALPADPFPGHLRSRLLKIALALFLAGSAILLAG